KTAVGAGPSRSSTGTHRWPEACWTSRHPAARCLRSERQRSYQMITHVNEGQPSSALAGLAHFLMRHRRLVAGVWIALTIFGAFSAQQVSKRWLEQFSIPGFSAYEANQRTLKTFGSGEQAPNIAVLRVKGDVTKSAAARQTLAKVAREFPRFRT